MANDMFAYDPVRRRNAKTQTPIEKKAADLIREIEKLPADTRLTSAQTKVIEAFELLADYRDGVER